MAKAARRQPEPSPSRPGKMEELAKLGQSVWLDFIDRRLLASGRLRELVNQGLRGLTSNPSIFEKAIETSDYDDRIHELLSRRDYEVKDLFDQLSIADIREAADILMPVYEQTGRVDGLVSLELAPFLANDAQASVEEARRLWKLVDRPNLMIKVPATEAGLQAFEKLISEGISINVTLLFSQEVHRAFAEAYLRALESRVERALPVDSISSVASFFVSRIDSAIDKRLSAQAQPKPGLPALTSTLRGRVAIANARCAYQTYLELFREGPETRRGARWQALRTLGARPQRLLWASTSTKNPKYRDVLYVEELIGPDTVNTIPPATLEAFEDHGVVQTTLGSFEEARENLRQLERAGISLEEVTDGLTREGIRKFAEPYGRLLATLEKKRRAALRPPLSPIELRLPILLEAEVGLQIEHWQKEERVRRLWRGDASLWTGSNESSWLGWLRVGTEPDSLLDPRTAPFAAELRQEGFEDVVVLGMGGSSLCADLLGTLFDPVDGYPVLHVLDSTDPDQIRELAAKLDMSKTLFVVSSKSGTTLEPNLLLDYFYGKAPASHFIAITDPGTRLETKAHLLRFREIFHGVRDIGGRYSALSSFGLIPAATMGLDPRRLLRHGLAMAHSCSPNVPAEENPGLLLGAALGTLGKAGHDKITLVCSPEIWQIGEWLEQLLAESTGKRGTGLLPVCGEKLGPPSVYGKDRAFIYLRINGSIDRDTDARIAALEADEFPVIRIEVCDCHAIAGEFFRWEFATAVAGSILGINPFDQPDVESAKEEARRLMQKTGEAHESSAFWAEEGIELHADSRNQSELRKRLEAREETPSLTSFLRAHLDRLGPGDYCALLAYLPPEIGIEERLEALRLRIRDRYRVATTLGFGPRYLHSTGQIHKGGPATGVFIEITADARELPIPERNYGFGFVESAQARGDFEVLNRKGRRILRIHLKDRSHLRKLEEL